MAHESSMGTKNIWHYNALQAHVWCLRPQDLRLSVKRQKSQKSLKHEQSACNRAGLGVIGLPHWSYILVWVVSQTQQLHPNTRASTSIGLDLYQTVHAVWRTVLSKAFFNTVGACITFLARGGPSGNQTMNPRSAHTLLCQVSWTWPLTTFYYAGAQV